MKKIYTSVFFLMCAVALEAQQLPHFSQYFMNEYVVNPAIAGKNDHFDIRTSQRHQWVGIDDAPRTYTVSLHGPMFKETMGMGVYAFTDITGPTRRTGFQASYAYHLKFSETTRLALSASLGLLHYAMDGSKIELRDENDPSLGNTYRAELMPDAKFAAYFYTSRFYAGITVPNLIQNRLSFYERNSIENRLVPHFMLLTGYKFQLNDDWIIEPSAFVKFVNPAPLNFDLTLRVHYKTMLWAGVNYRSRESFTPVFGYTHKDFLFFGYGYDILTNNLQNYSAGSHEFMVGIRLNRDTRRPEADEIE